MKLVTMIVPDTMTRTLGGSRGMYSREVGVDAETILNALTANDYHENWFFPDPTSVTIMSIEVFSDGQPRQATSD